MSKLRGELRSLQDRYDALERKSTLDLDPLANERAFLRAVRIAYARDVEGEDRFEFPLQRMRVGREFLDHVRALEGVGADKIVEVAAQVACGKAHTIDGREVHPLREGQASRQCVRARDGAKAWRCALQVRTPSARRLHWWLVPGPDGATVEFASVGVHDEVDIPE